MALRAGLERGICAAARVRAHCVHGPEDVQKGRAHGTEARLGIASCRACRPWLRVLLACVWAAAA